MKSEVLQDMLEQLKIEVLSLDDMDAAVEGLHISPGRPALIYNITKIVSELMRQDDLTMREAQLMCEYLEADALVTALAEGVPEPIFMITNLDLPEEAQKRNDERAS